MKRNCRAWAAGFFDGEGCVRFGTTGYKRNYHRVTMSLAQNERAILERFRKAVGCGKVYGPYHYPGKRRSKPNYLWMATTQDLTIQTFIRLRPWLGTTKTAQFRKAIAQAKRYTKSTGRAA